MARKTPLFACTACGAEASKWAGRCADCGAWNSLEAVSEPVSLAARAAARATPGEVLMLGDARIVEAARMHSGFAELDRVLGGGFVAGSVVLLGGDPGIGKSTLLLQVTDRALRAGRSTLYVAGEESPAQIRLRAERMGCDTARMAVLAEHRAEVVSATIEQLKPDLVIIDSVQTLASESSASAPGSVSQLREVTAALTDCARRAGAATVLVGHVTKTGALAGPRVVEHLVDTVVYLEGEAGSPYRIVRAAKNRFGSTLEVGLFEMFDGGLLDGAPSLERAASPGSGREKGVAISALVEGSRAFNVEVQALVATGSYGPPRLTCVGIENGRVQMIAAILERHVGDSVAGTDLYVNVVSGLKLSDPSCDLAVALALVSSARGRALPSDVWVVGEVGLTGELRPVAFVEARVHAAVRAGFRRLVVPAAVAMEAPSGTVLLRCARLQDAVETALDPLA
jgi:DNA repair protein RadA/Sms